MDKIFSLIIILFLISCNEAVDIKKELQTFTLQNDYLKVIAKKNGAELISIKLLEDNTEYLWQGDTITWSDHAIVQFPIIGNLKNDGYQFNKLAYKMMSHGFARISDFKVIEKSNTKMVFQLKSSATTKEFYPFEFTFRVTYLLDKKSIKVTFDVLNEDKEEMYFSLGYHPGFNCPLKIGENMEDYYLEFSEIESANRLLMKDNLIDSVQTNYLSETNKINLNKSIFQEDAIILKDIKSTSLSLKNKLNDKSIKVDFGEVPYLGIWSPKRFGDFVCIEPWFGIPDKKNASGNLKEKEGVIELPQKSSYNWECTITIN